MRLISIVILSFVLSACNHLIADTPEQMSGHEAFKQSKVQILQSVSLHVEVLNRFKACVSMAKAGPDLVTCKKNKHKEIESLRKSIEQDRAKYNQSSKQSASE